jgi:glycerol-3-phosphate O-acyltransferase
VRHYLGAYQADPPRSVSSDPEVRLALQKMAFEVAWRINHATPVSGTALITTMLLPSHGRAWTLPQLRSTVDAALTYLKAREVPLTRTAEVLATNAGVLATLDSLSHAGGPVTKFDGGEVTVWAIESDQQLAAAFYRNSIIHFFLERSISELALHAAQVTDGAREARFWDQALELRDLLKFDFYFQERDEYRTAVAAEMRRTDPDWTSVFGPDPAAIDDLLRRMQPLTSSLMLRPFLEAYGIVADVLAKRPELDDEPELVGLAVGLGRQYRLQGTIRSDEPVSVLLFRTALKLARNRGLLDRSDNTAARRHEFAEHIHAILRDLRALDRRHDLPMPWESTYAHPDRGAAL